MPPTRRDILIAIDGPAASGKSTTARLVAERLGLRYVNTGALYRAVTWALLARGIWPAHPERISEFLSLLDLELQESPMGLRVLIDSQDVTEMLQLPEVSAHVSAVSALPEVRSWLLQIERALGAEGGVVFEGRDIGTVVFPEAELKVFLTAELAERARRRWRELRERGSLVSLEEVEAELRNRDAQDATRTLAPLRPAPDAKLLDTTLLSVAEQVERIVQWAEEARRARQAVPASGG
ncbi:MAG: (d)CMP kinase [Bacteroidetes bacterium]|nr:(d)CMP kinase [Rhodothermia bacterium]MCS7155658.1 (d)CMP kinase [Bacteroidota bacterium]MCX7906517.1 (d)CMP kinase [Bacteroidota bacterium]MDW8137202.1 (d)CMP kinase [Bacteroidota bacterium]MDW8284928.1 (d)CMP kinase [Bacteroidota bacterium]